MVTDAAEVLLCHVGVHGIGESRVHEHWLTVCIDAQRVGMLALFRWVMQHSLTPNCLKVLLGLRLTPTGAAIARSFPLGPSKL
jgi:hypothetical protein